MQASCICLTPAQQASDGLRLPGKKLVSWCPADNVARGKLAQAPPVALTRPQDGLGPASAAAPQLYSRKALPSAAQRSNAAHQQWVAQMRAHFAEVGTCTPSWKAFVAQEVPLPIWEAWHAVLYPSKSWLCEQQQTPCGWCSNAAHSLLSSGQLRCRCTIQRWRDAVHMDALSTS